MERRFQGVGAERGWMQDSYGYCLFQMKGVHVIRTAVEICNSIDLLVQAANQNLTIRQLTTQLSPLQYTPYDDWHTPRKAQSRTPHSHTAIPPHPRSRSRRSSDCPERAARSAVAWKESRRTRLDGDWSRFRLCDRIRRELVSIVLWLPSRLLVLGNMQRWWEHDNG